MATKIFTSYLTKSGFPQTGQTPTISIWEITAGVDSLVVNNQSMVEISGGFYKYVYPGYNLTKNYLTKVDAGVSFPPSDRFLVAATESYQEEIANEVWETPTLTHDNLNTMGSLMNDVTGALQMLDLLLKYAQNKTVIDSNTYTMTIFDDNGTTPILVFDLKDESNVASVQNIFKRIPSYIAP